jgi:hypothetical protein
MAANMISPPPPWTNQPVELYHGTVLSHARVIVRKGVQVVRGRLGTDFGRGFYTTTQLLQAQSWALATSMRIRGSIAAVVRLQVDRESLASLEALAFVGGNHGADDFWSLVVHCRNGAPDHARPDPHRFYDVVYGPVAAFWQQRVAMLGADQISFHTSLAEVKLQASTRSIVWSRIP